MPESKIDQRFQELATEIPVEKPWQPKHGRFLSKMILVLLWGTVFLTFGIFLVLWIK